MMDGVGHGRVDRLCHLFFAGLWAGEGSGSWSWIRVEDLVAFGAFIFRSIGTGGVDGGRFAVDVRV